MKNNIYIGLATVIAMLSLAVFGLFNLYNTEKSERKRVSENMIAVITDKAKQQELTVKELKTLYPKYDPGHGLETHARMRWNELKGINQ